MATTHSSAMATGWTVDGSHGMYRGQMLLPICLGLCTGGTVVAETRACPRPRRLESYRRNDRTISLDITRPPAAENIRPRARSRRERHHSCPCYSRRRPRRNSPLAVPPTRLPSYARASMRITRHSVRRIPQTCAGRRLRTAQTARLRDGHCQSTSLSDDLVPLRVGLPAPNSLAPRPPCARTDAPCDGGVQKPTPPALDQHRPHRGETCAFYRTPSVYGIRQATAASPRFAYGRRNQRNGPGNRLALVQPCRPSSAPIAPTTPTTPLPQPPSACVRGRTSLDRVVNAPRFHFDLCCFASGTVTRSRRSRAKGFTRTYFGRRLAVERAVPRAPQVCCPLLFEGRAGRARWKGHWYPTSRDTRERESAAEPEISAAQCRHIGDRHLAYLGVSSIIPGGPEPVSPIPSLHRYLPVPTTPRRSTKYEAIHGASGQDFLNRFSAEPAHYHIVELRQLLVHK
ncbi:hypothetical protein C8R47DRAFT_569274 [Mycena vitilis]|nr:hypothetical protein C8R47DRAFT_569274 [Mycena vitilis]